MGVRDDSGTEAMTSPRIEWVEGPAPAEDSSVPPDETESELARTGLRAEAIAVPPGASVELPEPVTRGVASLEEALARRRSIRDFSGEAVTLRELSQLLWAAQGMTMPGGARTSPSAGATYPLELYAATSSGCHRYIAAGHRLERLGADDLRPSMAEAAYGQTAILDAAVVIIVTAVLARTRARYGERASRYASLEAGHVAQSILLQAVALGLGAVPVGAFDDERLRRALGVTSHPVYVVAIGHPRGSGG